MPLHLFKEDDVAANRAIAYKIEIAFEAIGQLQPIEAFQDEAQMDRCEWCRSEQAARHGTGDGYCGTAGDQGEGARGYKAYHARCPASRLEASQG